MYIGTNQRDPPQKKTRSEKHSKNRAKNGSQNGSSFERGPLVFALSLQFDRKMSDPVVCVKQNRKQAMLHILYKQRSCWSWEGKYNAAKRTTCLKQRDTLYFWGWDNLLNVYVLFFVTRVVPKRCLKRCLKRKRFKQQLNR